MAHQAEAFNIELDKRVAGNNMHETVNKYEKTDVED